MTDKKPFSSFVAGIAGGSASTILLYPLDLVKVRMQVDETSRRLQQREQPSRPTEPAPSASSAKSSQSSLTKNGNNASHRTNTICTTIRGVIRNEGYLGLYRGLTPAVIGSAASWGGFFILYEEIKGRMLQYKIQKLFLPVEDDYFEEYDLSKDMHVDEEIDINTNLSSYDTRSRNKLGGYENNTHRVHDEYSKRQIMKSNNQDQILRRHQQPESQVKLGAMEHFSASCLAGACMVFLTNPIWLIKTRLQLQNNRLQSQLSLSSQSNPIPSQTTLKSGISQCANNSKNHASNAKVKPAYRGLIHAACTIIKEEGFFALYKGSIPALMLVSHGGIQFVSYEFLKSRFAPNRKNINNTNKTKAKGTISERLKDSLGYLVMGATSKFIASTTTYPLQVIKARLQQRSQVVEMSETTGEIIVTIREYRGVSDCVARIWKCEGVTGFFKGCVTNALRVAPSAAITFVVYEWVLDVLTTP